MRVSIFTPTHDPSYLEELYDSIKDQDFHEWVIVPNGRQFAIGRFKVPDFGDTRVKIYPCDSERGYVGELKKFAISKCEGDIVLEVDHDDLLTFDAIDELKEAFADPNVGFVYSNCSDFRGNFVPTEKFSPIFGWQYRPFIYKGHELNETVSFEPTPASVSRIWFAPNHFRAWRRSVYEQTGGHSPEMRVLDDQDLMARTYTITKMKHINKCLYLYRVTGENTWLKYNEEIQNNVMRIYNKYILPMSLKWAKDNNLRALDLGGGIDPAPGLEPIDLSNGFDLEKPFPFPDNSVGVIRAHDFLEHISDKLHVIKEIYRVLVPGGYFFSMTPCALSQGGFQDPTHKSYYVENSFKYYTEKRFARYIDTPVRFQALSLYTTEKNSDGVAWVVAHLMALKGQPNVPGIVLI